MESLTAGIVIEKSCRSTIIVRCIFVVHKYHYTFYVRPTRAEHVETRDTASRGKQDILQNVNMKSVESADTVLSIVSVFPHLSAISFAKEDGDEAPTSAGLAERGGDVAAPSDLSPLMVLDVLTLGTASPEDMANTVPRADTRTEDTAVAAKMARDRRILRFMAGRVDVLYKNGMRRNQIFNI